MERQDATDWGRTAATTTAILGSSCWLMILCTDSREFPSIDHTEGAMLLLVISIGAAAAAAYHAIVQQLVPTPAHASMDRNQLRNKLLPPPRLGFSMDSGSAYRRPAAVSLPPARIECPNSSNPIRRGSGLPLQRHRRGRTRVTTQMMELPFQLPNFFKPDEAKMRNDPRWLSKVPSVKSYAARVEAINALAGPMEALDDAKLRAKTSELRERVSGGESLDSILVEAFAVVREASRRTLGLRHYDVQLVGGMVLHEGRIAEMKTGEGKTLVATLALYLHALAGEGAHLVTVNDYLARRDAETLGVLYRFLGLSVGVVQADMGFEERRQAYGCDITYVTNNEVGFDYLRDNMAYGEDELVQTRGFAFCIVDEADSILIDEARTPLIISAEAPEGTIQRYQTATEVVRYLKRGEGYKVDEKARRCTLTDDGYRQCAEILGVSDLYDPAAPWVNFLNNALNALTLYQRDVHYIVRDGQIVIVDEFTGRVMEGRRWSAGLHQAVEAKEGVEVQAENTTAASVAFQGLFKLYPVLSGMTGTASTEIAELERVYNLDVVSVPTARPLVRNDRPDQVYGTKYAKFVNVQREVSRRHATGQPVLVGTTSIEDSVLVGELLKEAGVPHRLLNAKPEVAERESEIVSQAGRRGAVTIATNMAGRGTDILLGGNAKLMARLAVREALVPSVRPGLARRVEVDPGLYPTLPSNEAESLLDAAADAFVGLAEEGAEGGSVAEGGDGAGADGTTVGTEDTQLKVKAEDDAALLLRLEDLITTACELGESDPSRLSDGQVAVADAYLRLKSEFEDVVIDEREEVRRRGGLAVIGTERHESRRIDDQLRGRSGRQGDAGETVFMVSMEDSIFQIFGAEKMQQMQSQFSFLMDDDEPLSSGLLSESLSNIQKKVEAFYQDTRSNLVKYDTVTDKQRRLFYKQRRAIVLTKREALEAIHERYARALVADVCGGGGAWVPLEEEGGIERAATTLRDMCPAADVDVDATVSKSPEEARALLEEVVLAGLRRQIELLDGKEAGLTEDVLRFMILREMDRGWKEQLRTLDLLREGVGFQAFAQKDPLLEWQIRSNDEFNKLQANIYRYASIALMQLDVAAMRRADAQVVPPVAPAAAAKRESRAERRSKKKGGVKKKKATSTAGGGGGGGGSVRGAGNGANKGFD